MGPVVFKKQFVTMVNAYNRSLIEARLDSLVTHNAHGKITDGL